MSKLDRDGKNSEIDRMLSELHDPKVIAFTCGVHLQSIYRRMRERDLERAWLTRDEKELIRTKRRTK